MEMLCSNADVFRCSFHSLKKTIVSFYAGTKRAHFSRPLRGIFRDMDELLGMAVDLGDVTDISSSSGSDETSDSSESDDSGEDRVLDELTEMLHAVKQRLDTDTTKQRNRRRRRRAKRRRASSGIAANKQRSDLRAAKRQRPSAADESMRDEMLEAMATSCKKQCQQATGMGRLAVIALIVWLATMNWSIFRGGI